MVVVVIIGILVAVAIPVFSNVQQNARINAHNANVRILQGAATQMMATNMPLPTGGVVWDAVYATGTTAWTNYLMEWPENPLTGLRDYTVNITAAGVVTVNPPAQ